MPRTKADSLLRYPLRLALPLILSSCVSGQTSGDSDEPSLPEDTTGDDSSTSGTTGDDDDATNPVLLVSGYNSDTVHRIDVELGVSLGDLGSIPGAQSITVGPDQALYIVAEKANQVVRIAGETHSVFVGDDANTPDDELHGLSNPTGAIFGPDGLLYVAGFGSDSVHRFDGQTGAFVDVFADAEDGLDGPDAGLAFDAQGHLYVPCFENHAVVRFDAAGQVVQRLTDGVRRPRTVLVRDDGEIWVTAWGAGKVLRFGADGSVRPELAAVSAPTGIVADLASAWVTTDQTSKISHIDLATGTVSARIDGRDLGIDGATFLMWAP